MGEPAEPSAADRAEARDLAAKILDAVRADAPMPWLRKPMRSWDAGECYQSNTVDEMLTALAHEVELLRGELGAMRGARDEACDIANRWGCRLRDAHYDPQDRTRITELRKVGAK